MTTPRAYYWDFYTKRAEGVDNTGSIAHYYTAEAQSLYLHNGIARKDLYVFEGHWDTARAESEESVTNDAYTQLSWAHPSTGALYGTAILDGDENELYLLRYCYVKEMGTLVANGNYRTSIDNPIVQVNADIKNYDIDAFAKNETLFTPGAKATLGIMMGDSEVYDLCEVHLDQVDFEYYKDKVSISGRNRTGHYLNDQTINLADKKTDTVTNLCKWVLDSLGLDNYEIEANLNELTIEYNPPDTGLSLLQKICDEASGVADGTDWGIEEMPDGEIIIGYNAFRAMFLPKSVFKFGMGQLFKRSSSKCIDGTYSKIYCTGKDSNGNDLTPVIKNVTTFKHWTVAPNKTYFAQTLENTTQNELENYALTLAKQLKKTGLHESYNCTIRPQLLVGDYATCGNKDIGIITEISHTFGEKGFNTSFTADSGGDKKTIVQTRGLRSVGDEEEEKVYTSARRNKGLNRKQKIIDFIKNTAVEVVRSSGGSGGSSQLAGVTDVLVDGTSVVTDHVAEIDLTGKQDVLTAGDRISINSNTISASIEPFSIVDGKMCITYKGESE